MNVQRYLVIGRKVKWAKPTTRITTNTPNLESHEIAIMLNVSVPDELFDRPQLKASITVPDESITGPVIEADVLDNIQEVISKELGLDLQIQVINTTQE